MRPREAMLSSQPRYEPWMRVRSVHLVYEPIRKDGSPFAIRMPDGGSELRTKMLVARQADAFEIDPPVVLGRANSLPAVL